jgi:hypothetical protein
LVRTWWLGICAVWIGCVPSGLLLEVTTADPAIRRVELFVAGPCEGACPAAVAPPGLTAKPSDIFLVTDPRPWSATVDHGIAAFELRADEDASVPLLLAVGFDAVAGGSATAVAVLYDVPVPASGAAYWQMPLSAATPIDDTTPTSHRVAVWRQPSEPGLACVMIEHAGGKRELVVPKDDTDCDQVAAGECAPWTNLAVDAPSTIAAASCLLMSSSGTSSGVCQLGGPTCSEVPGPTTTCAVLDTPYCAPTALCACGPWDEDCVQEKIALSVDAMPMIRCELPLTQDGAPCNGVSELRIPVASSMFLANSSATCEDTLINDLATPLGAFERSVTIGGATLAVKRVGEPCATELVYAGKLATSQTSSLLVDLALDNHEHLVVPLRIKFLVGSCDDVGPLCSLTLVNDSMFSCARKTPTGAVCGAHADCAGPLCGGVCCTTGEQCVNDLCMCGDGPGCTGGNECAAGLISPGCGSMCCGPNGLPCEF